MKKKKSQMQLKRHLRTMDLELRRRLSPNNRFDQHKGIHYFKGQIEKTQKLINN